MFELFEDAAIAAIELAQQETRRLGHRQVSSELLLVGLAAREDGLAGGILQEFRLTLPRIRQEVEKTKDLGFAPREIPFNAEVKQILERAILSAGESSRSIGPAHLLLALMEDPETGAAKLVRRLGVEPDEICIRITQAIGERTTVPAGEAADRPSRPSRRPALEKFATDLTQLAATDRLDPVVGREQEIERVVQILARRSKNNPLLLGEPGVGKTAIAEGLAQRIVSLDVPELLQEKRVLSLDMGALVAGTQLRGEFEQRIKQIVAEVRAAGNIILAIDEVHTLVGAGGESGMNAANLLKPALARGELQCLGATTLDEYRQHIEGDAALARRFQPIAVGEPSVEETVAILRGIRARYEQHHRAIVTDEALVAAAKLSDRYITDRYLPDKAIDLIDEASSRVRLQHAKRSPIRELKQEQARIAREKQVAVDALDFEAAGRLRDRELEIQTRLEKVASGSDRQSSARPTVLSTDIAEIVATWTGVPVNQLAQSESTLLLKLEETLHQRVIGQEAAIQAVSRAIRRARVGLGNPDRPIASFIFCGPTGVGKTELTKALAAAMFGSEEAMVRLDMSEYMEAQSVAKLIGSPPGYLGYGDGGQLTEAIRRQPYAVLLLDEIEKAHPDVCNLLLQVLEDGRLTDSQGRVTNFKNVLIIMTSNLGAQALSKQANDLGFAFDNSSDARWARTRTRVHEALQQFFRPEFLNRLDDVIVFQPLDREEVAQIADLLLQDLAARLAEQQIALEVTAAFKDRAIAAGYDPAYGARPLRRAIASLAEDPIAEAILTGRVRPGETAKLDIDGDRQVIVVASERSPALTVVSHA